MSRRISKAIKLSAAFLAIGNLSHAHAATITQTITGVFDTGSEDYTGVFYPGVTNTNLSGTSFTLTFSFDDGAGSETVTNCSGSPCASYVKNATGTANPGTATLTTNSHSFVFADVGRASATSEAHSVTSSNGSYMLQAGDGGLDNGSGVSLTLYPSSGSLGNNWDWRKTFTAPTLSNSSYSFEITENNEAQHAAGYLKINSASTAGVNGPSCDTPISETTAFDTWGPSYLAVDPYDPTVGGWRQTLKDLNPLNTTGFSGGKVSEASAATGTDSCYNNAVADGLSVPFNPATGVSGGTANVNAANQWGDSVGYTSLQYGSSGNTKMVPWYQQNLQTADLPCGFTIYQTTTYQCPSGGTFYNYGSTNSGAYNTLRGGISSTQVGSQRSGQTEQWTNYP